MLSFLSAVYALALAHGPAILAFVALLAPTLITGLSNYPQASGLVSALRLFLNIFSVVSHKDSPGTFKAPLAISKAPDEIGQVVQLHGATSLAVIVAILAVAMLGFGCASVFGATAKRDLIDCGEAGLRAAANGIAPQVSGVLTGGDPNWNSALGTLELSAGDAVLCAVAALVRDFEAAHSHPQALMSACAGDNCAPDPLPMAIERGRIYLAGRPTPVMPVVP